MPELFHQRCHNHQHREAVARCPRCRQFYCRECITEHEDQVICASCLRKLSGAGSTRRRRLAVVRQTAQCAMGVLMAWFFFYLLGWSLLKLPSSFHEGTIWNVISGTESP